MQHAGLLTDEPLTSAELAETDSSRLRPLIDALYGHLAQLVVSGGLADAARRGVATRIGLFGGLGQGKSTVLRAVLDRLDASRGRTRIRASLLVDLLLGNPVLVFDASHFQAADLEWKFFEAILSQRIARNRALLWGPVAVLACWGGWSQFHVVAGTATQPIAVAALAAAAAVALPFLKQLLELLGKARKTTWGAGLGYTRRDILARFHARTVLALPRVVIIDDLDRATVEQQRAVLRAARRYSELLGFGFVVSMDESALLASQPNPEAPEDLLRKVVQVEMRVPDRGAEDFVLLAALGLRSLARCNPTHALLLRQPLIVGDLARLLALWPRSVGPRVVKRLTNDMWSQVHALGALREDMVLASLRLQMLLHAVPALRQQPDALRDALEQNRLDRFESLAALPALALMDPDKKSLVRLLSRTRAMQPQLGYAWHHLVCNLPCDLGFVHSALRPGLLAEPPTWALRSPQHALAQSGEAAKVLRYVGELIDGLLLAAGRTTGRFSWDARAQAADGGLAAPTLPGLSHRREEPAQRSGESIIPKCWLDQPIEFHAHVWALWLVRLALQGRPERAKLYELLEPTWLADLAATAVDPAQQTAKLALLTAIKYWHVREMAADAEYWAELDIAERVAFVAAIRDRPLLGWLLHVDRRDMPHGLRVLQRMGNRYEELAGARWAQPLRCPDAPSVDVGDAGVILWGGTQDALWPRPLPDLPGRAGWIRVLRVHTEHWAMLRHDSEDLPAGIVDAWHEACPVLSVVDRLAVLSVAYSTGPVDAPAVQLERLLVFFERVVTLDPEAGRFSGALLRPDGLDVLTRLLAVICDLAAARRLRRARDPTTCEILVGEDIAARLARDFPAWCTVARFRSILAAQEHVSADVIVALAGPAVSETKRAELSETAAGHWIDRFRSIIRERDDAPDIAFACGLPVVLDHRSS